MEKVETAGMLLITSPTESGLAFENMVSSTICPQQLRLDRMDMDIDDDNIPFTCVVILCTHVKL